MRFVAFDLGAFFTATEQTELLMAMDDIDGAVDIECHGHGRLGLSGAIAEGLPAEPALQMVEAVGQILIPGRMSLPRAAPARHTLPSVSA
jgi:hypothetical protein